MGKADIVGRWEGATYMVWLSQIVVRYRFGRTLTARLRHPIPTVRDLLGISGKKRDT